MVRMLRKALKNEHGFSMLELLVYIGIVGVIAAFAVPRYTNTMAMANTATAITANTDITAVTTSTTSRRKKKSNRTSKAGDPIEAASAKTQGRYDSADAYRAAMDRQLRKKI